MLFRGGVPVVLVVALGIAMCLGLGWANGAISVKGKIEPFLVTLSTMYIFRGIAMTLCAGRPIPIRVAGFADVFGNGKLFGFLPTPVVILVGFFILTVYLYYYSKFGFYIRSIGGNIEAARVAGIAVDRIKMFAYTLSGLYSAMSGLILASLMNAGMSDIGQDLALDAIAAVILGGTAITGGRGTVWGTLGGALIMGVLNSGLSLLGAQTHQQVLVKGIVIILAVLMSNVINRSKN
jgi:ribose/xylose/arabinose/galactoside ABC-type transport system permease subunit